MTDLKTVVEQVNLTNKSKTEKKQKKMNQFGVGLGHPDNYIVTHFQTGYCTNDWEKLIRKTALLFTWLVKMIKKKQPDSPVTTRSLAVAFWIKVTMQATRVAHSLGKLSKLTLWEQEGMMVIT